MNDSIGLIFIIVVLALAAITSYHSKPAIDANGNMVKMERLK